MSVIESGKYIESPAELLSILKKDPRVKIVYRSLPWDHDIELVDFYLDCKSEEELAKLYLENKCRLLY